MDASVAMSQLRDIQPPPLLLQGRVGVGLYELAAMLEFTARLLHPTPALPSYTEGREQIAAS